MEYRRYRLRDGQQRFALASAAGRLMLAARRVLAAALLPLLRLAALHELRGPLHAT